MSEQSPQVEHINTNIPEDMGRRDGNEIDSLVMKVNAKGEQRMYSLDANQKHEAISHDKVLEAYGYDSVEKELPKKEEADAKREAEVAARIEAEANKDIYDEYSEAVKSGDASKDETFRDWVKKGSMKDAAKWYTATRAHGEGVDPVSDRKYDEENPFPKGVDQHVDADDTEALNAREGKENPTDDDVEYYRWLKNSSGRAEKPEEAKPKDDEPKEVKKPVGTKDPDEKDPKSSDEEKSIKTVVDITMDPQEARKYWEANHERDNLGPWQTYLLGGHNSWVIRRDVEVEQPPVVIPFPPVKTPPIKVVPPVKPPVVNPPVVEPPAPGPRPIPQPPRAPGRPDVRRPERRGWKKVAAVGLGILALVGLAGPEDGGKHTWKIPTGVSEPVEWSGLYDIDTSEVTSTWNTNHRGNVPEVRSVDESDNAFGKEDVNEETRTEIVDNYDTAKKFFDKDSGIATEEGKANFQAMEDAVKEEAAKIKAKHGDSITMKRATEVAEAKVKAQLAALNAAETEAQAVK